MMTSSFGHPYLTLHLTLARSLAVHSDYVRYRFDLSDIVLTFILLFIACTAATPLVARASSLVELWMNRLGRAGVMSVGSRWRGENRLLIRSFGPLAALLTRLIYFQPWPGKAARIATPQERQPARAALNKTGLPTDPRRQWLRRSLTEAVQEAHHLFAQTQQLPESPERDTLTRQLNNVITQVETHLEGGEIQEKQEQLQALQQQSDSLERYLEELKRELKQ